VAAAAVAVPYLLRRERRAVRAPRKEPNVAIAIFFVLHWQLSVFFQSFFLHRYGAHRQFEMSPRMERVFYFLTWFVQGASFLSPRGYAILHRLHHAYSDTPKDPHSPTNHKDVFSMMWATKLRYEGFVKRTEAPEAKFDGGYPEWPGLDKIGDSWATRIAFGTAYTLFYMHFATHAWMYLLLPAHYLMGPIHGAIVNWAGHKYGYRNYASEDVSRNTLVFDFLTAGELFQNNHHTYGMSPSFAVRKFEVDPTYVVMKVLDAIGLIDMTGAQKIRWTPADREPKAKKAATATPILAPAELEPGE
jgi:stearoyl-CoA desaturase (delta-9 desaturase)